ncbi:hypothetical protein AKG34_22555 [Peribacillus butanolivorans]|nr:hypothetical protein AKG34_22555 [Peribacillus butanolivorans]
MFFKSSKNPDKNSVNIAFYCTFIYWSVSLLINSFLQILHKDIPINSLFFLLTGLVVFFVSEAVAKYIKKKNH